MAQRVIVGTGITENYYPKTQHFGYFETLNQVTNDRVRAFAVLLDPGEQFLLDMIKKYPNVLMIPMRSADVKSPNPNKCLQHGAFIDLVAEVMKLDDTDYVLFTDSDMTIQRQFAPQEIDELARGPIFVASNWHDHETLLEEAASLQPKVPLFEVERAFPGVSQMKCYNTGVLGATVADWRKLLGLYARRYPLVAHYFEHYARQQWLLSYLLQTNNFTVFQHDCQFVRVIHTHGHEPRKSERLMAQGVRIFNNAVYVGDVPVLFAHNLR